MKAFWEGIKQKFIEIDWRKMIVFFLIFRRFMLYAVDLYHRSFFGYIEIHYIMSYKLLPVYRIRQPFQKLIPYHFFFRRHVFSQSLRIFDEGFVVVVRHFSFNKYRLCSPHPPLPANPQKLGKLVFGEPRRGPPSPTGEGQRFVAPRHLFLFFILYSLFFHPILYVLPFHTAHKAPF